VNPTLSQAAESMQGILHGADRGFDGVSTDSRTLKIGELFFALSGPNFDGGEFVGQAGDLGAAAAVVRSLVKDDVAQITVDDTRLALGRLGAAWRHRHAATVVGVTGSNGKTTIKEMITACLSQIAPTLATAGNLNNDIGMPLMLLRIDPSHRYAVLEMGANHAGEIGYLTSLAQPDVVVISNAGRDPARRYATAMRHPEC
jgi:UDP-N-acetylmuramoyl-tripeptide--D-alanyl-D-alanine ligase